jgi:polar amino acid transport system ATP-binding protein
MLIVKNIVKKFHGKKVIDDVSFDVAPGQIVVLLGQSGVGKSTILRVLSNLEAIDAGSMILDEHISPSSPALNGDPEIKQDFDFSKVGMVFQDFNLFAHLTVEQNLTLPLTVVAKKTEDDAKKIAQEMLQRFEMGSKATNYPVSLSGGQKQRVALARALCMNPKLLCLDEPTSALDPQLTEQVAQIIAQLAAQKIMVVIATHDIGLLQNLNCTIHLMAHGKIIETATTAQLQKSLDSFGKIKNFMQGKTARE